MKKMKKTVLIYLLSIGFAWAQSPPLNPFFEKYKDDDRFTQVYISGKMLNLITEWAEEDEEDEEDQQEMEAVNSTLRKLNGIRILSMDNEESGKVLSGNNALNPKDLYLEARSLIEKDQYDELMTVKDSEEEFLILIKEKGDIVEELILIGYETEDCCDEDSFFLLSLYGEIDLKGISDIGEALDIEELEKLEKMEDQ